MFILNTTYVISEQSVPHWKNWMKETLQDQRIAVQTPDPKVYKINHQGKEEHASFAVQFHFENINLLHLFQKELDLLHQQRLAPLLGTHCLFFTTILCNEAL